MWLKISYIGLTAATVLFLMIIGFKAIEDSSSNIKKDKITLVIGLLLWQLLIFTIASSGILKTYDFPPRFALAFILPSFIFTGIFLYRNRNEKWINSIPESWIIYFQSYRILVETLFVFTVARGILNPQVTIEGYNVDMIFAFSAPIIAYQVYERGLLPRRFIRTWNYIGLTVIASIIFLFMTSLYKPEIYGSESPLIPLEAFSYPYVLIAGFLMPTAVFLHILSIIQLHKKR